MKVQSDATIETLGAILFLKAKRIKSSNSQPEQRLAEYLLSMRKAGERLPLLLLILSREPPVRMEKRSRTRTAEVMLHDLEAVYARPAGRTRLLPF